VARRLYAGLLLTLMAIGGFSLWTVIPIGWIWMVSQLSESQQPKLSSYLLILVGIVGSVFVVAKMLAALNHRFLAVTGREEGERIPLPWMQSMRDERRSLRATALDIVLVASAVLAVVALVIWFFVAAGSPLPSA
jgi:hypothetical protein